MEKTGFFWKLLPHLSWFGPIAAGAAFLTWLWTKLPAGISPLVLVPFAFLFFVAAALIQAALKGTRRKHLVLQRYGERNSMPKHDQRLNVRVSASLVET